MVSSLIIIGIIFIIALISFLIGASLYTTVHADVAHVVIQKRRIRIISAHTEGEKSAYFRIPQWFFLFGLGMVVHEIPLKQMSVNVPNFLAFDKDRARFICNIVAYVVVDDPLVSAKRFSGNIEYLKSEVSKQVQAITRDATTKRPIREIINDRQSMIDQIKPALKEVLETWGLDLTDIELLEFKDPITGEDGGEPSHVISDISSIIEEQINSEARQKNAEQRKIARIKEAEADELSQQREIERDEVVAKRKQDKNKLVAIQEKLAREEELEVIKVQEVKSAEIAKAKAIVKAEEEKATEEIKRDQKKLEGEGDRLRAEERAKGEASPIREKGLAEAEAKMKLQDALNKFGDNAIRALTAELIVRKDETIGIALADAIGKSDTKIFAGGESAKQGFNLASLLEATSLGSQRTAEAVLNKVARPNELVNLSKTIVKNNEKEAKK